MELFFTCPETGNDFATDEYSLLAGHCIETCHGQRELHGKVRVNSCCPHCGAQHIFSVQDVLCPLTKPDDNTT